LRDGLKEVGMRSKWMRRLGLAAITGAVSWLSVGCAQERDPINRVQSNALDKSFFVGKDLSATSDDPEFYMRNTVVDVPYGAAQDGLFTATYAQPLSRVKWEITEQMLIARQTYEHISDSDHAGSKRTNNGQVVAMFAIASHFDIRRSYNPQTGEENNVVEENSSDRPWYQRQYFRVDWSKNLVTDGYEVDTLSQIGIFGGVKFDPLSYFVEDPASPDAPVFAQEDGYFDVTTKAFATPQVVDTPFGAFPACFLPGEWGGSYPIGNCNPTEVTLRLSFKAVVDNDYEATDQDGPRQEAFGWFTVDRFGYERNYGILDEKWHRFAAKYNIWEKSHVEGAQCAVDYWRDADGAIAKFKTDAEGNFLTDANTGLPIAAAKDDASGRPFTRTPISATPVGADLHADTDGNGTEDQCEFHNKDGALLNEGSRCDVFAHKCTLPLYGRKIKTIPWYYGKDGPPDLFASTAVALGQWNLAVKRAAQLGKMVEARRVNIDAGEILTTDEELVNDAGKTVPEVFVLCHNPVVESDHPSCGKPGLIARIGDIRYNSVNLINTPQTPSPWGIMVDADDPLTGEKVSTSVNEWAHVLDIASQGTEDLLRWINGEISDKDITSGKYLRDWVASSKMGTSQHVAPTLDGKEVASRIHSVDTSVSKMVQLTQADMALPKELRLRKAAQQLSAKLGPSMDPQLEASRQQLVGSKWEAQLITPEWLQAAGMDPKTPVAGDDKVLAKASPLRGMNPHLSKWLRRMKELTMAKRASCMVQQPEPDSLVGMARQAQRLYPMPDKNDPNFAAVKAKRDADLHTWIREQFHIAVIAHEMGHSMGLRHNFTGSLDALNYHPQYWQLRTRNGAEHYCAEGTDANGKKTAVPAKIDPKTGIGPALLPQPDVALTDGKTCVGPRWYDPVTDDEVNGLIWKWGSSTVMDYPGDVTQDMNNIGPYDKAAMRFGYADIIDIDTDSQLAKGPKDPKTKKDTYTVDWQGQGNKASAYIFALDGFGGIVGNALGNNHYSTYADKYGVLGTCSEQSDPSDVLSARCTGPKLDYATVRDMHDMGKYGDEALDHLPSTLAHFAVDKNGRVRHPYMFGSDEYADTGNVPVFRFDAGADAFEQFQFLISTYENRYIFDNFRRDRSTFNTRAVLSRAEDRYFDKIQGMTKSLALLIGLNGPQAGAQLADPGGLMPLALGASDGLKMWARILTRPEPGPYQTTFKQGAPTDLAMDYAVALSNNYITLPPGDFNVSLGAGEGRYLHNDYDYTQGYYWSDYQLQVGTAYEKSRAAWYMLEAYNHFLSNSKEDYVDGRYKNLSYASIYPNQVRRLFSQLLQNDPFTYGPFVTTNVGTGLEKDGKTARVQYLPWEKFDEIDPTTVNLEYSDKAIVLDPLFGWEQQLPMLINLFVMGPTNVSMDVIDQTRIFSPGGADSISIDPNEQVRYKDPLTGIIYVARSYGKESINPAVKYQSEKAMGARMIQYANQIAAKTFVVDSVDHVTGELTYKKDGNNQPICKDESCTANKVILQKYAGNLDVVRQLTLFFGYGPLGHD
jgi:hypothetical protein